MSRAFDRMFRKCTAVERRWARAIWTAAYPRGADPRIRDGAADLDLEDFLVAMLETLPPSAVLGLRAALFAVAVAPAVTQRRALTIADLDEHARVEVLHAFEHSDVYVLRSLAAMIKASGALVFASATRMRPDGSARVVKSFVGEFVS